VRLTVAVLPARIGHRNHAEERAERRRAVLLDVAKLPAVRAGALRVERGSHLLVDDGPLAVMEHLLALRQRQSCRLECRFGADQVGDLLSVFGAIVRDGDELDTEVHGDPFRC